MVAKPKLSAEEWANARQVWESDPRKGFPWLIDELGLPVSAEAVRQKAKKDGWVKLIDQNEIISKIINGDRYRKQFVYIVTASEFENIYKIGIAKDVEDRVRTMQTGCPFKLYAFKCYQVNDAVSVETMLHSFFHKKRLMGEWFRLNEIDLTYIDESLSNIDYVLSERIGFDNGKAD
jgi:predicted GIY-YIG superfamily endonuclease